MKGSAGRRFAAVLLFLSFFFIPGGLASEISPEVRAVWVTRFELSTPERISRCIEWARRERITHIFAQIRGRGTVLYASDLEAPSEEMPVPFDALALAIGEAHKAGIQLHAWMNITYVWSKPEPPVSPLHPMNRFPGAVLRTKDGIYMDIRHPWVAQHIVSLVDEVAAKYPVDEIHLDYIRYPFGFSPTESDTRHVPELVGKIHQKVKAVLP